MERNAGTLREKVAERSKLLSQLEQAKMQEKVSDSLSSMNELTNTSGPTLDSVRDKIERRYSKALGQAELASNSVEAAWPRCSRLVSRWLVTPAWSRFVLR